MRYREKLVELACVLMHILALGLPYGPEIFKTFVFDPVGNVRLLHYPPQEDMDELQLGGVPLFFFFSSSFFFLSRFWSLRSLFTHRFISLLFVHRARVLTSLYLHM